MPRSSRAAILAFLLILAATAVPAVDNGGGGSGLCILCGPRGLADFILNVGLYAPFGAALGAVGWPAVRAVGAGGLLSLAVEVSQIFLIAGRDASVGDLAANTLGTAVGRLAWQGWVRRRALSPGVAATLPSLAAAAAGTLLLAGLWLLTPAFPEARYYLQWTADLGRMEVYRGAVLSSRVGGLDLPGPPGPIDRSDSVRALLRTGAPVATEVRAGPSPRELAPVFSIYDHRQREIMLLGVDREDLVYRYRLRAAAFRLDGAEIRFPGALKGVAPGEVVGLRVAPAGTAPPEARGWCAEVTEVGEVNPSREVCAPGFTMGRTWTLLYYRPGWEAGLRRALDLVWLGLLLLPAGLLGRRWRHRGAAAVVAVPGLTVVPLLGGFPATSAAGVLAALVGIGVGGLVGAASLKAAVRRGVDTVRPVLRFVRHAPDRLLHPFRRRRLLSRLRAAPAPGSALFICLGNINRSPFAAATFERAMARRGAHPRVRSAGFIGPGRPAAETARRLAADRGLDLSDHVSRVVDAREVRETDLVVVMSVRQRRQVCRASGRRPRDVVVLGDLDPVRIVRRVIQDPYGHPAPVFQRVFDRIERCVDRLADAAVTPPEWAGTDR